MKKKKRILEEGIKLELNMSDLYLFYSNNFIEDKEFWQQMAEEEKEHASLFRMVKDLIEFSPSLDDIIFVNFNELKVANNSIVNAIKNFKKTLPHKDDAY